MPTFLVSQVKRGSMEIIQAINKPALNTEFSGRQRMTQQPQIVS